MTTLVFVLICVAQLILSGTSIIHRSRLHNFMHENEIRFYFGSDDVFPEYEIVDLPENLSSGRESVVDGDNKSGSEHDGKSVSFKVFDREIQLNLQPNKHLISPYAKIVKKSSEASVDMVNNSKSNCHYLHQNSILTASISNCDPKEIYGLIFLNGNYTLEILPLTCECKLSRLMLCGCESFLFQTDSEAF